MYKHIPKIKRKKCSDMPTFARGENQLATWRSVDLVTALIVFLIRDISYQCLLPHINGQKMSQCLLTDRRILREHSMPSINS
jgi:hypothetical protein